MSNRTVVFSSINGKSMETETTTQSDFPNGWKAIMEQLLALKKKK